MVHFSSAPMSKLTYSVQLSPTEPTTSANYTHGEILVTLPALLASKWAKSDQTTIKHIQGAENGEEDLSIAVEKDFRCLQHRPEEDESDNFPNPDPASCRSE